MQNTWVSNVVQLKRQAIKKRERENHFWGHYQSLSEKGENPLKHGRAWWHVDVGKLNAVFRIEWHFRTKKQVMLWRFTIGGEEHFEVAFYIPFIGQFYGAIKGLLPKQLLSYFHKKKIYNGLETSLTLYRYCLSFRFFHNEFCDDNFSGFYKYFDTVDFLFGYPQNKTVTIETGDTVVPMPEKEYEATYKITELSIWRPRCFKLPKVYYRIQIDVKEGIPHPGKGTCAHNCEDTATYSLSIPGKIVSEGVKAFQDSVIKCRETYPL